MVTVEQVWVAHDCGLAINPLAVEGQVQGAVWMGMGQALCEETQYHEGLPLRPNMLDYRIPTIVESPPIEVHLVESIDPLGPFGAKEASEGGLHGFPPALTNAICDAIGIRLAELPATPDRVLEAISSTAANSASNCGARPRRRLRPRRPPPRRQGSHGTHARIPNCRARERTPRRPPCSRPTRGARLLAGGTDLVPNLRRGIEHRRRC